MTAQTYLVLGVPSDKRDRITSIDDLTIVPVRCTPEELRTAIDTISQQKQLAVTGLYDRATAERLLGIIDAFDRQHA